MTSQNKEKRKWHIPHTYVLIFAIIILVTILTYIVPAGEFDRAQDEQTGRIFVVADSFHQVESTPVSPFDMFRSIHIAMDEVGYIIFFVLIIGGSFGIIQATGAIDAGIGSMVKKTKGKEKLVIPLLMFVFSIAGAILGSAEEMLPFYPIIISLAIALGFDSITGTAIVLLGAGAGFAGAFLNPFTVGIAQGIAGLPLFSGMWYRLICYGIILSVSVFYVYRYASKIQKNPELSLVYEADKKKINLQMEEIVTLNGRQKLVLLAFALGLIILSYGVVKLDFYVTELTAVFLIIGIVGGMIGGLSVNRIAETFVEGAKELVYGALVIGLATTVMVIMREGKIMDTLIFYLANMVKTLPPALSAIGMFFVQSIINVFVPSGSGQAAVSMPIMAPMADVVGITRQTSVLAFQFGDGFSNVISPTSGYFMAALAIGGIKWDKWAKWMWPLFLIWCILGISLVAISVLIHYGPF
ncbi:YfcC family protein [Sinanaerobacter sp. ZZT-01]|uniref:YfcC family protein n=1 Tax=Sinanaerobacter sp. ZZT-01 TaxID=3111540 RepID=UPI002D7710E0|nr:AbgT family transporter [Sinanaerobacter sp. ZZT-01]WRR94965.1 AbgT family transporter [Sinanaerobacter sp. ZZT-01]